jgi:hypothetical protein
VHETVYENRLGFTQALNKMGADIVVHPEGSRAPSAASRAARSSRPPSSRSDAAARRRRRRARPARRLQLRHRRARRDRRVACAASRSSAAATRSSSTSSPPWAPTSTCGLRCARRAERRPARASSGRLRRSSCPSRSHREDRDHAARRTCRRGPTCSPRTTTASSTR